jgi:hypothetical protein
MGGTLLMPNAHLVINNEPLCNGAPSISQAQNRRGAANTLLTVCIREFQLTVNCFY